MAQTLEHQQNVTVTPITLTPFSADVDVIQKLDDEPNDVGGLTAQELKEEFDKNGNAIKTFINGTLIPEVIGADATEQARQEAENERVANEIERVSNENARVTAENNRVTAETNRSLFEEYDSTKAYVVGNKVAYLGSSYRCILNTTAGINPLNTTYWLLIARKGVKGDTGDPGVMSATATVGTSTGTPTASVTLNQVTREMAFAFDGLKGETGAKGDRGDTGPSGRVYDVYKVSSGTKTSFLDSNNEANLTEITTAIDSLKNIGRFLSLWNAETGLPQSEPVGGTPYTYKTGDYYRVGTVGTGTNYKPSGSSYTGAASTDVETESVEVGWVYYYDGTQWLAQSSGGGSVKDVKISGTSILDAQGVANITATPYLTTAPTQAYAGPGKIDVILDSEPATYYDGYMYYIKE